MAGTKMGRDRCSGSGDVAEIRLVVFIERGGDADDNGVHFFQLGIIGGSGKTLLAGLLNFGGSNAENVRTAAVQRGDFALVDVEAGDREAAFAIKQRQREANVAEADNGHPRLALLNLGLQFRKMRGGNSLAAHNLFVEIRSDSSM